MDTTDPVPRDLPPLPKKRRGFICTKCGSQQCVAGQEDLAHPQCGRCDYLGFAQDCEYNDDQMHAYVLADRALAPSRETAPASPELSERELDEWLDSLERASDVRTRLHTEYQGKAMPDDVYERFCVARDRVGLMRRNIRAVLKASGEQRPVWTAAQVARAHELGAELHAKMRPSPVADSGEQRPAALLDGGFHEAYAEGFDAGKAQVSEEVANLIAFLDNAGAPRDCEDGWAPVPWSLRGRVEVLLSKAAIAGTRTIDLDETADRAALAVPSEGAKP